MPLTYSSQLSAYKILFFLKKYDWIQYKIVSGALKALIIKTFKKCPFW